MYSVTLDPPAVYKVLDDIKADTENPYVTPRPSNLSEWSVFHVYQWMYNLAYSEHAMRFYEAKIDGNNLAIISNSYLRDKLGIQGGW